MDSEKMQFLVLGLGRFGSSVALALAKKGHEVLAVDKDEDKVAAIEDEVSQALVLDATQEKQLEALGIGHFDWVIVSMSQNIEASILATLLAKGLGDKNVLSKASSDIHAKILRKVGADKVIFTWNDSPRSADPSELAEQYVDLTGKMAQVAENLSEAIRIASCAVTRGDLICITGSAYIVGQAKEMFANLSGSRA